MKRYKLNIFDNNHRTGFVFSSAEMLSARIERMQKKVESLSHQLKIEENNSDTELEIRVFVI